MSTVFLATATVLVALSAALAPAAFASPSTLPLRVVTGPTPFGSCRTSSGGTNFLNSAVEPYIAANPKTKTANHVNLIGVWQQDRWSTGAAHGIAAGYSADSGKSWRETVIPFSSCSGGGLSYQRASDPWVSIGPDGRAYAAALAYSPDTSSSGVAVSTSGTGGRSWSKPKMVQADNHSERYFNDKESATADPAKAGTAYVVWDRIDGKTNSAPSLFSRTTNGGRAWSKPKVIASVRRDEGTVGNIIVVDARKHVLYNVFDRSGATGANQLFVQSSGNRGRSWATPHKIADVSTVDEVDPVTGKPLRVGDITPEPAIDPRTGSLYVTWIDSRFSGGHDDVALTISHDGGKHWSTPVRVNPPSTGLAFTPSVAVASSGKVAVSYYDFRDAHPGDTTVPTDYRMAISSNGGKSFARDTQVAGDFDLSGAPRVGAHLDTYFLGDYQGLAAGSNAFYAFFARSNSPGSSHVSDIVFASIQP